jgi:hypothetical protein
MIKSTLALAMSQQLTQLPLSIGDKQVCYADWREQNKPRRPHKRLFDRPVGKSVNERLTGLSAKKRKIHEEKVSTRNKYLEADQKKE